MKEKKVLHQVIKEKTSQPKTNNKHVGLKIFISIVIFCIVFFEALFGTYLYKSGGSLSNAFFGMVKDVMGDQEPVFILVMGISEDIVVDLTDTILLIGYNPDTNQAFMLSIPRDTFVGKSYKYASGYDKINALYQDGPQKTVKAVEELTGVNIDYYVTVKTEALVDIVDTIGGVEYDVPINMNYDDNSQNLHIHLKAGKQILNGKQAEQLVRFRHNNDGTTYSLDYGDNDEGRMRTQREFMKVVAKKLIRIENIDKLKDLATTIFKNLSTNMELSKVFQYIPYVVEFDTENNLSMGQLPGTSEKINELWFYKADKKETKKLIETYINELGLNEEERAKYVMVNKKSSKL